METVITFLKANQGRRIALTTHQRPDGDALGSAVGLAEVLRSQGYAVSVMNPLPLPSFLSFIADETLISMTESENWWQQYDCVGMLDCGETTRLDPLNQDAIMHLPAFTIDHHASSEGVGQARWIEPGASSTGEMVVQLCKKAGWPLPALAAQALWTAIVTDTGRFSYENTTVPTLDAARECLMAGAKPDRVAAALYQSVSIAERRLQTFVLERMEFMAQNRLAVSWLRQEDFHAANARTEDSQNLINLLRDTAGVEAAIFLYELPATGTGAAEVKASLRTRAPLEALRVASQFQGGGHQRAAGCTIPGPLPDARRQIVEAALQVFFPDTL